MSRPDGLDDLDRLASLLASLRGEGLFPAIAESLALALGAEHALVSEAVDDGQVHTLGVFARGARQPNYQYRVSGLPCEQVLAGESLFLEAPVSDRPAYVGLPLLADDGRALGHLCASHSGALQITPRRRVFCESLAARAAAELNRRLMEQQVDDLGRRQMLLEARNRHLEEELKLIEREQLAAAAGVQRSRVVSPVDLDDNTVTGLHHVQREHILRVLDATRWVIEGNAGAALKLGMKPATLRHRMKKLGISRELRIRPTQPVGG